MIHASGGVHMIKAVIFDMDGLMFDTERVGKDAILQSGKDFGYTISLELHQRMLGRNAKDIERMLKDTYGEDFPYTEMWSHVFELMDTYYKENGIPVKDGLRDLLAYLKKKNIKVAVASSSKTEVIKSHLNSTNLSEYYDFIVGGDQIHHGKPDPEIFLKAVEHFQIKPEEALVLEDSKSGILAAHAGNIPVICIPDLVKHDTEITDLTWHTLSNLRDVIDVLENEA